MTIPNRSTSPLENSDEFPIYLFPSINSTGGDSFMTGVTREVPDGLVLYDHNFERMRRLIIRLGQWGHESIRLVAGHCVSFGFHEYFSRRCSYVGLFRDPVERVFSAYHNLRGQPSVLSEAVRLANAQSILEWQQGVANLQIRFLLGPTRQAPYQITQDDVIEAKSTISEHFEIVATNKQLDYLSCAASKLLRARRLMYWRWQMKNPRKPDIRELPEKVADGIREIDWADVELLKHVAAVSELKFRAIVERNLFETFMRGQKIFADLASHFEHTIDESILAWISSAEENSKLLHIVGHLPFTLRIEEALSRGESQHGRRLRYSRLTIDELLLMATNGQPDRVAEFLVSSSTIVLDLPAPLERVGLQFIHAVNYPIDNVIFVS